MLKHLPLRCATALLCCAALQAQAQDAPPWSLGTGPAVGAMAGGYSPRLLLAVHSGGQGLNMALQAWSVNVRLPYAGPFADSWVATSMATPQGSAARFDAGGSVPAALADLGSAASTRARSLSASVVRSFYGETASDRFWNLGAQMRMPLSNLDRALGPAKADYSLLAGLTQPLGDFSVGASVGYAVAGSQANYGLRNAWSAGVDASWRISPVSSLGLSYGSSAQDLDEATGRRLALSYAYTFSSGLRAQANVRLGLSESNPSRSLGLSLSHSY